MMSHNFQPDWISPPGDTILDILREKSISLSDFSRNFGETISGVDALLRGHTELTVKHAKKLESLFGTPHTFWLTREEQYRQDIIRSKTEEENSMNSQWLSELPLKDMVKFGWLKVTVKSKPNLIDCLEFFGVSSVAEWRISFPKQLGLASFRSSSSFAHKPLAVAAWLRKGEIEGNMQICNEWDSKNFQHSLKEIRLLSRTKSPVDFLPNLKDICAKVGVAVVIVRAPTGCRASGAARFLTSKKALMLLSFRHLTDDHFWFTFFHEAGHLILHKKELVFIDGIDSTTTNEENEANNFSASILVPDEFRGRLEKLGLNPHEILRFAKDIGISPGVVVGQMQNSGRIRHDRLNIFKKRYTWNEIDGCAIY